VCAAALEDVALQREKRYDRWALYPAMMTTCARNPSALVFGSGSGGVGAVAGVAGALVSGAGLELSLITISFEHGSIRRKIIYHKLLFVNNHH